MVTQLQVGDVSVDVVLKDIKNIHLSVYPPAGRVRISAPLRMCLDNIRVFAISKLSWIKQQQKKLRGQERETPREYLDHESHYVFGKRYLLKVIEDDGTPYIELKQRQICLRVRPGTCVAAKQGIFEKWYRQQVKMAVQPLISKWEPVLGVKVDRVFVQRMKTKWGSCTPDKCNIRLNTELAKKPPECLEYIVVHEMVHLRVRRHNDEFVATMDKCLPHWEQLRLALNAAPLAYTGWAY